MPQERNSYNMISPFDEWWNKDYNKCMKKLKERLHEERIFTLDLHGLPVREAKDKLHKAIDICFYNGYNKIRVIHGTGSGKLKDMTYSEALDSELIKGITACFGEKDQGYTDLILEDKEEVLDK